MAGPGLAGFGKLGIFYKTTVKNPMVFDRGPGTPSWLPTQRRDLVGLETGDLTSDSREEPHVFDMGSWNTFLAAPAEARPGRTKGKVGI